MSTMIIASYPGAISQEPGYQATIITMINEHVITSYFCGSTTSQGHKRPCILQYKQSPLIAMCMYTLQYTPIIIALAVACPCKYKLGGRLFTFRQVLTDHIQ